MASCMAAGSRVTFCTTTVSQAQFELLLQPLRCHMRSVRLVRADPLNYRDLAQKIDVSECDLSQLADNRCGSSSSRLPCSQSVLCSASSSPQQLVPMC